METERERAMPSWNRDAPLPSKTEFDNLNFTPVCQAGDGPAWWVEIVNAEQAEFAERASRTQVKAPFDAEARDNKGRPLPHRWFMLASTTSSEVLGEAIVAAPNAEADRKRVRRHLSQLHVVGFEGYNPYPKLAFEIAELSERTGIPMPPNFAGTPVEPSRAAKAAELLNAYGAAKFGERWLPEDAGQDADAVRGILYRSRIGQLADIDADAAVTPFVIYGDGFGPNWRPSEADGYIGGRHAEELRSLLEWVDAENAKHRKGTRVALQEVEYKPPSITPSERDFGRFIEDFPMLQHALIASPEFQKLRSAPPKATVKDNVAYQAIVGKVTTRGFSCKSRRKDLPIPSLTKDHLAAIRGIDPFGTSALAWPDSKREEAAAASENAALSLFARLPASCAPATPQAWKNMAVWKWLLDDLRKPVQNNSAILGFRMGLKFSDEEIPVLFGELIEAKFAIEQTVLGSPLGAYAAKLASMEDKYIAVHLGGHRGELPELDTSAFGAELRQKGLLQVCRDAKAYHASIRQVIDKVRNPGVAGQRERRPDPLSFLSVLPDLAEPSSLEFDRDEQHEWPDLAAYGVDLVVAILPTGKVVDILRDPSPNPAAVLPGKQMLQHADALARLGFHRHPVGVWLRAHEPVYVDSFRKALPETTDCMRTVGAIVKPSWEMLPDRQAAAATPAL